MKKVVIAEKPSVARDYANALDAIKKYQYYENSQFIICWSIGHLFRLKQPDEYRSQFKKWKIDDLPIIPKNFEIKLNSKYRDIFMNIKDLINRNDVDGVVVATDAGREGELIGRYILTGAQNTKPMYRVWLNSLTNSEIKQAFKNIRPLNEFDNIFYSAQARAECDWLLGINLTRAYSLTKGNGVTLSIGRCKTPVLALIYQRDMEIENFIPEKFFELECEFKTEYDTYKGKWFDEYDKNTRIRDQVTAVNLLNKVKGRMGVIKSIQKGSKSIPPPLLHNLTSLQRAMNRRYGYSAQKTLNIAQKLYEEYKIISYPRTSSQHISEEMIPEISQILKCFNFDKYRTYIKKLNYNKLKSTNRIVDNTKISDHTALIPIHNDKLSSIYNILKPDERNVFDEISLTFIACFFDDYIYKSVAIITEVEAETFITHAQEVIQYGWKDVHDDIDSGDESLKSMPDVIEGLCAIAKKPSVIEKQTSPPSRYTEDTLLKVMANPTKHIEEDTLRAAIKNKGIGTEATRANIIEELIDKYAYVKRDGRYLSTTQLGRDLVCSVDIELLKSPELTAEWEYQLEKIADGTVSKYSFMENVVNFIDNSVGHIFTPQKAYMKYAGGHNSQRQMNSSTGYIIS